MIHSVLLIKKPRPPQTIALFGISKEMGLLRIMQLTCRKKDFAVENVKLAQGTYGPGS